MTLDATTLEPMITFGTNPGMVTTISGSVPERPGDAVFAKALAYMGLTAGERMAGKPVQRRLHRQLHQRAAVGPASRRRRAARAQGRRRRAHAGRAGFAADQAARPSSAASRKVFIDAGAEWRESGCSMCLGMNGDLGRRRAVLRQHQQPQLRRPPGRRRAHAARQPGHRRRRRGARSRHRPARVPRLSR